MSSKVTKLIIPSEQTIAEAFPTVDPGVEPCGSFVLVQIRTAKKKHGSIILTDDTKDTEKWNTQVAKMIDIGPLAFRNRTTRDPWPEGNWAEKGQFVRVPKHGGDRWSVTMPSGEECLFVVYKDTEIIGRVTGDPLAMKAFV